MLHHHNRVGLSPPPAFPQENSRPGAMQAGFGLDLLLQVFASIPPGADSRPHLCLSPWKSPPSRVPWGEEQGKAPHTSSLAQSLDISALFTQSWINYRCPVPKVWRERNYLAEQLENPKEMLAQTHLRFEMEQEISKPEPSQEQSQLPLLL